MPLTNSFSEKYDMIIAKELITSAKECGADAVKFQSFTNKFLISKEEYDRNQSYDDGDGGKKHFGSLRDMVNKYYLREQQHFELVCFSPVGGKGHRTVGDFPIFTLFLFLKASIVG